MNAIVSFLGFLLMLLVVGLSFVEPSMTPDEYTKSLGYWPPELGKLYPDLDLIDQDGREFKLSAYKGRVILLQPVGMGSPASQAFSGAHKFGSYANAPLQEGLESIGVIFPKYTKGMEFPNADVIFIQVLLYGPNFRKVRKDDAVKWAKHFDFKVFDNQIVAVSPYDLRSSVAYRMIPGFQLIDKNFVLQADAAGAVPEDDLYKTLLPMVPIALNVKKR